MRLTVITLIKKMCNNLGFSFLFFEVCILLSDNVGRCVFNLPFEIPHRRMLRQLEPSLSIRREKPISQFGCLWRLEPRHSEVARNLLKIILKEIKEGANWILRSLLVFDETTVVFAATLVSTPVSRICSVIHFSPVAHLLAMLVSLFGCVA